MFLLLLAVTTIATASKSMCATAAMYCTAAATATALI